MNITLSELEEAINYWRALCPSSGEERALSQEVNALAQVYALMIFHRQKELDLATIKPETVQLFQAWRGHVMKA